MRLASTFAAALGLFAVLAPRSAAANGEPVDGYPTHDERVILVTINRVRANPDDQAAGNAQPCSTPHPPVPPVAYDAKLGHASRFHCKHLSVNDGGLSHQTFCTLDPQIATNGCDGAAACSCMAGTECWNCNTLGGCGSGPNDRAAIFGFAGGVAEVGAAGYGPAGAATGWSTECPPNEPHRDTLTNGGLTVVGTGYATGGGCWGDFEFADFGSVADVTTPRIASAVDNGGSIEANWYDPAGDPTSIDAVVDGVCTPMTIAVGIAAGNRDYRAPFQPTGACQRWYVVARAPGGEVVRYPDTGSLTVGCPDDWVPTQMDAACAACNDGETRPCTQADCAGTQACTAGEWGACDAPATCGAGGGGAGTGGTSGGGASGGGALAAGATAEESDGGCGCRAAGAADPRGTGVGWIGAALVALGLAARRGRRARVAACAVLALALAACSDASDEETGEPNDTTTGSGGSSSSQSTSGTTSTTTTGQTSTGTETTAVGCIDYSTFTPTQVGFAADVMPLFAARCQPCHDDPTASTYYGADAATVHQKLLEGVPKQAPQLHFVVPGDPLRSYMMAKVEYPNPGGTCSLVVCDAPGCELSAPPGNPLSADELAVLRSWVLNGAAKD